jgi:hypothetical protein
MTRLANAVGAYGERVAQRRLSLLGMEILDRNWRCPQGELDIVARDRQVIVFCEVKTRRSRMDLTIDGWVLTLRTTWPSYPVEIRSQPAVARPSWRLVALAPGTRSIAWRSSGSRRCTTGSPVRAKT